MSDLINKQAHRYVDLSEKVIATYYDDEHEEWSARTITIEDALDYIDYYTVLTSIEPKRKTGKWLPVAKCLLGHPVIMNYCCSECKEKAYQDENGNDFLTKFCPNCGAEMEV